MSEEKPKTNKLARGLGNICSTILALCFISIVIALTVKLVMWIIGF